MKKLALLTIASLLVFGSAFAQKRDEKRSKKDTETKIIIKTKDGEVDLEKHMENLGEEIGSSIEKFFESFEVKWDDGSFNLSFESDGDWEDFGKRIEESVNSMVNHMDIEMTNVDPRDFEDQHFSTKGSNINGRDIVREIEKEHNSEVENFERIDIKIREKEVRVNLKALLENGKTVNKSYREFRD